MARRGGASIPWDDAEVFVLRGLIMRDGTGAFLDSNDDVMPKMTVIY